MFGLYYAPGTCALATHLALEEAGARYEAVPVDFGSQAQRSSEYLAINAKGRVSRAGDGKRHTHRNSRLLLFVAQRLPKAELAPLSDPFALAQLQEFNSYLCSTVHVAHAHKGRGYRWANDETSFADMKSKVPQTMAACFSLIERDMIKGPWVMGETYTVCDPYLYTIATWLEGDGVDVSALPKVMAHRQRMLERPAVQKVLAEESLNS